MAEFSLVIITPERRFFDGKCESLILPAIDGSIGIMANHAPMAVALEAGELIMRLPGGETKTAAASEGFATVHDNNVLIVLQTAEWPEEIDINRAKRDERIAKERLLRRQSMTEHHMARAMLTRAMVRLRVSSHSDQNTL